MVEFLTALTEHLEGERAGGHLLSEIERSCPPATLGDRIPACPPNEARAFA
jgi:hypothetical protein